MRWPWQRAERRYTLEEVRSLSFQDVWGSGRDVEDFRGSSMTAALALVPVFACARVIADNIAAMPLEAYRKIGDDRVPMDLPALFQDPSDFGGIFEWVQRALTSMLLRGNAYGHITAFTSDAWPRKVEWPHPDEFSIMNNLISQIYPGRADWRWLGRPISEWRPRGEGLPGELIHIPWYTMPGFVQGLSPIGAFWVTIDGGLQAQKYGRNWFRQGGAPAGVLETDQPVNQQQAEEIKGRYKKAASGQDTVVLGAGTKYKPITVAPEESQFLQTIRANATQIASIYGLPPARVGGEVAGNSKTYANVEQEAQDLVNALLPYLTKLEQAFSNLMPRGQYVKFNVDALVRADLASRYAAHKIAIESGFMTVDEVREIEDMEPMEMQQQDQQQLGRPPVIVQLPSTGGASGG